MDTRRLVILSSALVIVAATAAGTAAAYGWKAAATETTTSWIGWAAMATLVASAVIADVLLDRIAPAAFHDPAHDGGERARSSEVDRPGEARRHWRIRVSVVLAAVLAFEVITETLLP